MHHSQFHVPVSYSDKGLHNVAFLGLVISKVLEVEGTDSKVWSPLNVTHTQKNRDKDEEERWRHGQEPQEA